MGDDLVELVKAMAEDVAVDLTELGSGFVTVEEPENPPLGRTADSAHIWFAMEMELIVTSSNCYLTVKKRVLQRLTIYFLACFPIKFLNNIKVKPSI